MCDSDGEAGEDDEEGDPAEELSGNGEIQKMEES